MADYLNYVLGNPDLRENAEALGLTQSEMIEWGKTHWTNHGQNEGRQNSPTQINRPQGFTEELSEKHYAHPVWEGRSAEDILQQTARSFYRGADVDDYDMWEAREGIDDAWNLGQFNTQGWNMAADNPYKTGIIGNTIAVNEDIGQLVPTESGNQKFIQDRYIDTALANDFPAEWVTDNAWTGPEDLGSFWDVLTNATRDAQGNLWRTADYDASTALGPSTNVGSRGLTGVNTGGGLLGNMYEAAYQPRGLLDWEKYQTDPNFILQENKLANYQPWAEGIGDAGALPVYGSSGGGTLYGGGTTGGGTTGSGGYTSVFDTGNNNTTSTGNIVTDASGKNWVMTSDGQWIPTSSDLGSILEAGDTPTSPFGHYDSNGMWVGAEGFGPTDGQFSSVGGLVDSAYGMSPAGTVGWGPSATFGGILGTSGPLGDAGFAPIDW